MNEDHDDTNPAHVEDQEVRSMLSNQISAGRLALGKISELGDQAYRWTYEKYQELMNKNDDPGRATTPAQHPEAGDWKKLATERLTATEGFRGIAYPDPRLGDKAMTIGYGFNLSQQWVRDAIKTTLGVGDDVIKAFTSRARSMRQDEASKVLGAFAEITNGEVTRHTKDVPLTYRQRAALVDLTYNRGEPTVRSILKTVGQGNLLRAAQMLASTPTPVSEAGKALAGIRSRWDAIARDIAGEDHTKLTFLPK